MDASLPSYADGSKAIGSGGLPLPGSVPWDYSKVSGLTEGVRKGITACAGIQGWPPFALNLGRGHKVGQVQLERGTVQTHSFPRSGVSCLNFHERGSPNDLREIVQGTQRAWP